MFFARGYLSLLRRKLFREGGEQAIKQREEVNERGKKEPHRGVILNLGRRIAHFIEGGERKPVKVSKAEGGSVCGDEKKKKEGLRKRRSLLKN